MATTAVDRLRHVKERITLIRSLLATADFDQALGDKNRWSAFERHLEVIAEASKHVPPPWKADHPEIEWAKIHGLGNLLRHEYQRASQPILWDIYVHDLDPLEAAIDRMIAAHPTS